VFQRLNIKASTRYEGGQLCAQEGITRSESCLIMVCLRCENMEVDKLKAGEEAYLLGFSRVQRPVVKCVCERCGALGAVSMC